MRTAPTPSGSPSPFSTSSKESIGRPRRPGRPVEKQREHRRRRRLRCQFVLDHLQAHDASHPLPLSTCRRSECTIWNMSGRTSKQKLVDQVVDHFVVDGLGDMSLRKIAAAIGTSHRMLLYHFGSKSGLLVEVVRAVEARARDQLAVSTAGPGGTDRWRDPGNVGVPRRPRPSRLRAPVLRALRPSPPGRRAGAPTPRRSDRELARCQRCPRRLRGVPLDEARIHARLGLAVVRGLLLDLLATGDRAGVDAALEVFAGRYAGRWWESSAREQRTRLVAAAMPRRHHEAHFGARLDLA